MIAQRPAIRWAIKRDIESMASIDWDCHLDNWQEGKIDLTLRIKSVIGNVCEDEHGDMTGFSIYSLKKTSIEILRLGVIANDLAHWHIAGHDMLERIKEKLTQNHKRDSVGITIDESAVWQQLVLRECGFVGEYVEAGSRLIRFVYWEGVQ